MQLTHSNRMKWLLDIVAVGTIADCMPLVGENRALVYYGLKVLNKTRRMGYRQMFHVGGFVRDGAAIRAETVAYYSAASINAAGRMSWRMDAFALLRETRSDMARTQAKVLEKLNKERQT